MFIFCFCFFSSISLPILEEVLQRNKTSERHKSSTLNTQFYFLFVGGKAFNVVAAAGAAAVAAVCKWRAKILRFGWARRWVGGHAGEVGWPVSVALQSVCCYCCYYFQRKSLSTTNKSLKLLLVMHKLQTAYYNDDIE